MNLLSDLNYDMRDLAQHLYERGYCLHCAVAGKDRGFYCGCEDNNWCSKYEQRISECPCADKCDECEHHSGWCTYDDATSEDHDNGDDDDGYVEEKTEI